MPSLSEFTTDEISAMSGQWIRNTVTGELGIIRYAMPGVRRAFMKLTIPTRETIHQHTHYSDPANWETTDYPPAWNPDGTPRKDKP